MIDKTITIYVNKKGDNLMKKYVMGNEAIAMGALAAGVKVVSGYPGTPATEIVNECAKGNKVYVEWSVNEKVAIEIATGASLTNQRSLAVMKHNGTNVATDFIMHLNFTGVRGGMVLVSADDPGGNSSQNEEDTRILLHTYGHLPVFDPANIEEAISMIKDAFELSEKSGSCFILRPVMRICHSRGIVDVLEQKELDRIPEFQDDRSRFVMSAVNEVKAGGKLRPLWRHSLLNQKQDEFIQYAEESPYNSIEIGEGTVGFVGCGIGYSYIKEAETLLSIKLPILKLGTLPLPKKKILSFIEKMDTVVVFEEIEPVVEGLLKQICCAEGIMLKILGRTGFLPSEGELTTEDVIKAAIDLGLTEKILTLVDRKKLLPVRTRTQCIGCSHRGMLSALKQAAKRSNAIVTGDIGCYDAGSFPPIELQSTIFCMGSSIPIASGLSKAGIGRPVAAVIGDSTFFHNGLLGLVNAVYNESNITIIVCDNKTTAMTGFQPHAGSGVNIKGDKAPLVSLEKISEALGLKPKIVNPYYLEDTIKVFESSLEEDGVSFVIVRAPCFLLSNQMKKEAFFNKRPVKSEGSNCNGCKNCIAFLGCPALYYIEEEKKVNINYNDCVQCGLCADVCKRGALVL